MRCEEVRFAEVEFPQPVKPRLVVRFSDGLSLLMESREATDLAAEFIVAAPENNSMDNRHHFRHFAPRNGIYPTIF